jgi:hypothetical protein
MNTEWFNETDINGYTTVSFVEAEGSLNQLIIHLRCFMLLSSISLLALETSMMSFVSRIHVLS